MAAPRKHSPSDNGRHSRRPLGVLGVAALVVLGFALYANSFRNRALFHHDPNIYTEPLLDDTVLKSLRLLPVIFSNKFLVTSYGEYRPLGYALFALINSFMPDKAYVAWRVILIAMHTLTALLVFGIVRLLLGARPAQGGAFALGVAALYLAHPAFAPLVNDVNLIYFLWGLLFSALTLWLYLLYLKRGKAWWLLLSVLAYGACVLTYSHAVIVPALAIMVGLLHEEYPRVTVTMLIVLTVAAFLAGSMKAPVLATSGVIALLAPVIALGLLVAKRRFLSVAKTLIPFVVVTAIFLEFSKSIFTPWILVVAVIALKATHLQDPFQFWHAGRFMMAVSDLYVVSIALVVLTPLLYFVRRRWGMYGLAGVTVLLFAITMGSNRTYRDDVTYWRMREEAQPTLPNKINLARAFLNNGQWEEARDKVMGLYATLTPQDAALEPNSTINIILGRAYEGMGNKKVAGAFFFLGNRNEWHQKAMNNRLKRLGDFCFRIGYISAAEHFWACGLVCAPYDVELNVKLGRALVYKNFFRAAERYFEKALRYDADNDTALYHLAFIAKTLHRDRAYTKYCRQWKEITGAGADPDFEPLLAGFRFDREKMVKWFSRDPLRIISGGMKDDLYRVDCEGQVYDFHEVPLEVGDYFSRGGQYQDAIAYYHIAQRTNPRAEAPLRKLAETYARLQRPDLARPYRQRLENMSDEK